MIHKLQANLTLLNFTKGELYEVVSALDMNEYNVDLQNGKFVKDEIIFNYINKNQIAFKYNNIDRPIQLYQIKAINDNGDIVNIYQSQFNVVDISILRQEKLKTLL